MENNAINDVVLCGLDQQTPMLQTQVDILSRVDTIIDTAVQEGNPDLAAKELEYLGGISRISGLASAKFIYTFKFNWKNFPQSKYQTFEDYADEKVGYHKSTVKRYFTVWNMFVSHDIPKEYSDKMKNLSIKSLVPISTMWSQGVQVEPHQWMMLSQATDAATVNKIIRDIKGVEPKKGSIQIEMQPDGTLYAWKDEKRYFVGTLNVEDKEEVVQKAISRLIGDGRVLEN